MSKLGAEKILAVGAVWLLIMLPSAAFGGWAGDKSSRLAAQPEQAGRY